MKSLRELFWSLPKYADKWDPYFDVYETWFAKFRGQSPRILEVGVQHGGSAHMWLEYFGPGTKIVGVDVDPRCAKHATDDIEIVIGDQGSETFWQEFFTQHTEPFDIVIDDGGHRMEQMIMTFVYANPRVKDGGIYLIEDCHTAYWAHQSLFIGPWDRLGLYNTGNIMEFTKVGLDTLNREHIEPHQGLIPQLDPTVVATFKNVRGVHYYNSMIVFEIGPQRPFTRCLNSAPRMEDY
jgi:hypothetical protein